MRYLKIACLVWASGSFAGQTEWKSWQAEGARKHSLSFISFDGLLLHEEVIPSKIRETSSHVILMPDGTSKDIQRESLGEIFSRDFNIWISPCRHTGQLKLMGMPYTRLIYRKFAPRPYEKILFRGNAYFDHTDFELSFQNYLPRTENIAAILPAHALNELLESEFFSRKFSIVVILSPPANLTENPKADKFFNNTKILWVANSYRLGRLQAYAARWGGEVKTFPKSGYGYRIFMRHHTALNEISDWMKTQLGKI